MSDISEEMLRKYIREMIEEELDEISTTANVAGYQTPIAFAGNSSKAKTRIKQIAQQLGYKLTGRGSKDVERGADKIYEVTEAYISDLKMLSEDIQELKPHQQLGSAISIINRQIFEIERAIKRHKKFKVKENVQSGQLWKKTMKQLIKLESRLLSIATQIREIRN